MERKFCQSKPPFCTIAVCVTFMLYSQPLIKLSSSADDNPAHRPAPVPRGVQGKGVSDGAVEFQPSSRKKPSTFLFPRPYSVPLTYSSTNHLVRLLPFRWSQIYPPQGTPWPQSQPLPVLPLVSPWHTLSGPPV